jgi:hypothetical protein
MPEERHATTAPIEAVQIVETETPAPAMITEAVPAHEQAVAAPVVHTEPAPILTPTPPRVRAEPAPPPTSFIEVEKALQESGLVLVQTDPHKVHPAEPPAEPQFAPASPRPRRAPPPDTGPLQIVETRKDA